MEDSRKRWEASAGRNYAKDAWVTSERAAKAVPSSAGNSDIMLGESFDGLLLEVAGAEGDQRKGHTALGGESAGTVDVHNPAANAPFLVAGHQTFEIRIGLIGIRERTCQPLGPEVQGRVAQRCAAICHAVSSGWSSLDGLSGAPCQG